MKVLVFAFECDPKTNSEPGIAACWVKSYLDAGHDVVLYTHGTQTTARELDCEVLLSNAKQVRPKPTVALAGALQNMLLYNEWLSSASSFLRSRGREFDLVHHISWSSARLRSPLLGYTPRRGQRLVWGPLGGGHLAPWKWALRGCQVFEIVRNLSVLANGYSSLNRSPNVTFVACNQETSALLRRRGGRKLLDMSADLLREDQYASAAKGVTGEEIRLLWVGRMVSSKRPDVSIYALASLIEGGLPARLEIAGKGPERERLLLLAHRLGVSRHITWLDWIEASKMVEVYRRNDILLYTSVRDSGWSSALEAAAQGTPAVGFLHQGFGASYRVSFDAFVNVDPGAKSDVVGAAFADAVRQLIDGDYSRASGECIDLAQAHRYRDRAAQLLAEL